MIYSDIFLVHEYKHNQNIINFIRKKKQQNVPVVRPLVRINRVINYRKLSTNSINVKRILGVRWTKLSALIEVKRRGATCT